MNILFYIFLSVLTYIVNIVPALMPPTWIILAFLYINYHLHIIPVVVLGAIFATLGRVTLYLLAKKFGHFFISKKSKENVEILGKYVNSHMKISIPLFILYAFLPIPSNQVYIAAGLSRVRIKYLAVSFFFGRILSYFFWVSATHKVTTSIQVIFSKHYARTGSIIAEIIGFGILFIITKIDWVKVLKINKNKIEKVLK